MTMSLAEADRMTQPIWSSKIFKENEELIALDKHLMSLVPKGELNVKNPHKLTQFEFVDPEVESAFLALITKYEELTGEDVQKLRYRQ